MDTYEKKYKESLALMVDCIPDEDGYVHVRPQDIFPELKESGDERIGKVLIDYFKIHKARGVNTFYEIPTDNVIAWLEKQYEHANFRNKIQIGDKVTRNRDGVLVNLSQLNRVAKKDEKQSETYTKKDVDNAFVEGMALAKDELEKQGNSFINWNKNTKDNKPHFNHSVLMLTKSGISEGEWQGGNQWLQYRWSGIVRDSDVTGWMELSVLEKQSEQKPAWSKEDEVYMCDVIAFLEDAKDCRQNALDCINWLKTIKERIGGQYGEEI